MPDVRSRTLQPGRQHPVRYRTTSTTATIPDLRNDVLPRLRTPPQWRLAVQGLQQTPHPPVLVALVLENSTIDPRTFAKINQDITRLGLGSVDPGLATLLGRITPESTDPTDLAVWPHIIKRYEAVMQDYDNTGLISVPPQSIPKGFAFGYTIPRKPRWA